MTKSIKNLHRLPIGVAALVAATPAFAHEAGFFHTHAEGAVAVLAVVAAAGLGWKLLRSRRNDKTGK